MLNKAHEVLNPLGCENFIAVSKNQMQIVIAATLVMCAESLGHLPHIAVDSDQSSIV